MELEMALLQATGLLPNHLGVVKVEQPIRRIPTGIELQRRFESVNMTDDELVSDAERA